MPIGKEGNVKWVDGLRGIASTLVVFTHIARAFDDQLFLAVSREGAWPMFFQLPFIRILTQGRIGVSIFSFVTGYVCALKPVKLCHQSNQSAAFASISKSASRRIPRLVIPTSIATLIIFVMAQFGLFLVGKQSDCWWCDFTGPDVAPGLVDAFKSLLQNLISTWTQGRNEYDGNQWTLLPLLRGSMQVYAFVMVSSYFQPCYRIMASLVMFFYFYLASDPSFGMQFFWGTFLCELQLLPAAIDWSLERPRLSRILAGIFVLFGLYVASYPEGHPEWAAWSRSQHTVLSVILPTNSEYPRFSSGIGLELITLGIHFSTGIKDLLSNRYFLWLGKQSFAVYLLHGPLLRSVLCWMVYGFSLPDDVEDENGNMVPGKHIFPGALRLFLWLPLWIPLNYGVAMLWTGYVDPWCAQLTEKLVGYVTRDTEEKEELIPR